LFGEEEHQAGGLAAQDHLHLEVYFLYGLTGNKLKTVDKTYNVVFEGKPPAGGQSLVRFIGFQKQGAYPAPAGEGEVIPERINNRPGQSHR
jgi:hypothetical protein